MYYLDIFCRGICSNEIVRLSVWTVGASDCSGSKSCCCCCVFCSLRCEAVTQCALVGWLAVSVGSRQLATTQQLSVCSPAPAPRRDPITGGQTTWPTATGPRAVAWCSGTVQRVCEVELCNTALNIILSMHCMIYSHIELTVDISYLLLLLTYWETEYNSFEANCNWQKEFANIVGHVVVMNL